MDSSVILDVPGFYKIVALQPMRQTEGVTFEYLPMGSLQKIDGIDRVVHEKGAMSPGRVGDVERPWYMHPHQEDQLLVLAGERDVDIYSVARNKIIHFTVTPDKIVRNGIVVYEGGAMLTWYTGVFHRVCSCGDSGSTTINFATRHRGFNIQHEFDIFDLDTITGEHCVVREGFMDQPK